MEKNIDLEKIKFKKDDEKTYEKFIEKIANELGEDILVFLEQKRISDNDRRIRKFVMNDFLKSMNFYDSHKVYLEVGNYIHYIENLDEKVCNNDSDYLMLPIIISDNDFFEFEFVRGNFSNILVINVKIYLDKIKNNGNKVYKVIIDIKDIEDIDIHKSKYIKGENDISYVEHLYRIFSIV